MFGADPSSGDIQLADVFDERSNRSYNPMVNAGALVTTDLVEEDRGSGEALERRYVRDVLSVMHMCGIYDFTGRWAYGVGIPAKSGGIMAVIPGTLGIGVFSPGLGE